MTEAAADAIEEAVARHTVAIITNNDAGEPLRGVGSGAAILWNGRPLILTAKHVVRNTPTRELRFFASAEGPMRRLDTEELRALPGVPTSALNAFDPIRVGRGIMSQTDNIDLALLEISENRVAEDRLRFFELSADSRTPPVNETTLAIGYPSVIARQLHDNNWVVFSAAEWTSVIELRQQPQFNPDLHFLTTYNSAISDNLHPRGFSGAGIWFHASGAAVWHPNVRLAGIITHFYAATNLLKQTRIECVVEFLRETIG